MQSLIIGGGEIGRSLFNVFSESGYYANILDKEESLSTIDSKSAKELYSDEEELLLHIAIPYNDKFVTIVKKYQKVFKPKYTVIHSTVPIGTSRKCKAVHSPVVGLHPFMEESLKTFTKFLGGEDASEVAQYFRRANIKVYITDNPEATELMKIQSTTFYGTCIEFNKETKELCDKNKVPFELWTLWTDNYNKGYNKLGHSEYTRPKLIPIMKKVGGHCVTGNLYLIKSKFSNFLKKLVSR